MTRSGGASVSRSATSSAAERVREFGLGLPTTTTVLMPTPSQHPARRPPRAPAVSRTGRRRSRGRAGRNGASRGVYSQSKLAPERGVVSEPSLVAAMPGTRRARVPRPPDRIGQAVGVLMGADAASAFLIGRLALDGRQPSVVLRAVTPGPWRGLTGVHVFAVADDRLWLAQPRVLGEPAIASVPLSDVGGARLVPGRRTQVELRLNGRSMRWTVLDDAAASERFVEAVDS